MYCTSSSAIRGDLVRNALGMRLIGRIFAEQRIVIESGRSPPDEASAGVCPHQNSRKTCDRPGLAK